MKPLGVAALKTGMVSMEALAEMRRWGLPLDIRDEEEIGMVDNIDDALRLIRDALEGRDQVQIQESDLDLLRRFLDPTHQQMGKLMVKDENNKTTFDIPFCTTLMGEFVLPWKSEGIRDMMTMGESTLRYEENGVTKTVCIIDVRESYFGNQRTFMVCTVEVKHAGR